MNGQAQEVDTFTEETDESFPAADEFQEQEVTPPVERNYAEPVQPPIQPAPQEPAFNPQEAIEDAANQLALEWKERQAFERVENSVALAREKYTAKNGLPAFDDLVTDDVVQAIAERPDLKRLVLAQPQP